MKKIVAIVVIIWIALCCIKASAQETCINNIKIDSLSLSISHCHVYDVPREFLKYSKSYAFVTVFAGLVFNDSVYHDSTELELKRVEIYALGLQNPKDTMTVGNLVVMPVYLGEPPCGWTNGKRNRFLKKSSKQLSRIFKKGIYTIFFEKQLPTPFFIDTISITLIEHL